MKNEEFSKMELMILEEIRTQLAPNRVTITEAITGRLNLVKLKDLQQIPITISTLLGILKQKGYVDSEHTGAKSATGTAIKTYRLASGIPGMGFGKVDRGLLADMLAREYRLGLEEDYGFARSLAFKLNLVDPDLTGVFRMNAILYPNKNGDTIWAMTAKKPLGGQTKKGFEALKHRILGET